MILNFYKSYTTDNLYVRSTAVHAVTVGQSGGDLGGCGYRKIPVNVILLYPKKLSFLPTKVILLPTKMGVTHKNWQKKESGINPL